MVGCLAVWLCCIHLMCPPPAWSFMLAQIQIGKLHGVSYLDELAYPSMSCYVDRRNSIFEVSLISVGEHMYISGQ